jgi:hypothetical protein
MLNVIKLNTVFLIICIFTINLTAQVAEAPLKFFGYFQTSFQYQGGHQLSQDRTTFSLQQLNLFFQKDLARNWTSFVNFEILNNFSMSKQWGAINLEEAWVRYRASNQFNLKLGLQIPEFNNLNQIKNRTPLLPYIIRPLVYETSFNEFLAISEFIPEQAFIQVYGFIPRGDFKFDYAAYIGNSPNIETLAEQKGQSGQDSTTSVLIGGRIGIRVSEFKAGLSGTYEKSNEWRQVADILGIDPAELNDIPRVRFGGDFSFNFTQLFFESEFIKVRYDENFFQLDVDRDFYYGTLGYYFNESFALYGGYYQTHERLRASNTGQLAKIETPGIGATYAFTDRIKIKTQYARVIVHAKSGSVLVDEGWNFFATAISVIF